MFAMIQPCARYEQASMCHASAMSHEQAMCCEPVAITPSTFDVYFVQMCMPTCVWTPEHGEFGLGCGSIPLSYMHWNSTCCCHFCWQLKGVFMLGLFLSFSSYRYRVTHGCRALSKGCVQARWPASSLWQPLTLLTWSGLNSPLRKKATTGNTSKPKCLLGAIISSAYSVYSLSQWCRNIWHAFKTILKEEGGFWSGCLYQGLPATVLVRASNWRCSSLDSPVVILWRINFMGCRSSGVCNHTRCHEICYLISFISAVSQCS